MTHEPLSRVSYQLLSHVAPATSTSQITGKPHQAVQITHLLDSSKLLPNRLRSMADLQVFTFGDFKFH